MLQSADKKKRITRSEGNPRFRRSSLSRRNVRDIYSNGKCREIGRRREGENRLNFVRKKVQVHCERYFAQKRI